MKVDFGKLLETFKGLDRGKIVGFRRGGDNRETGVKMSGLGSRVPSGVAG